MAVFIKTFGCKVNYADSVGLARRLSEGGAGCALLERAELPADSRNEAAVFVVNTCAVTAEAVAKARRFCRRLARVHPAASVIVTGCGARAPEVAAEFTALGVAVARDIDGVLKLLGSDAEAKGGRGERKPSPVPRRARHFLKVQDGCNAGCSYCIIPRVRKRESGSWQAIQEEFAFALENGALEVVVTGVNLGLYRTPDTGWDLPEFLRNLLDLTPASSRIRLSSVEPEHVDERLLAAFAHRRMCPHLHLPLQSGSDAVLKAMRRQYASQKYRELVHAFRNRFPWASVTTDVMVGYPTETREDFAATVEMMRACEFERMHIFRFSPRPDTAAESLAPLPPEEVKARERELFEVAREVSARSLTRYLGRSCEVAVEGKHADCREGYGEAYQRVRVAGEAIVGQGLVLTRLQQLKDGIFTGVLEQRPGK